MKNIEFGRANPLRFKSMPEEEFWVRRDNGDLEKMAKMNLAFSILHNHDTFSFTHVITGEVLVDKDYCDVLRDRPDVSSWGGMDYDVEEWTCIAYYVHDKEYLFRLSMKREYEHHEVESVKGYSSHEHFCKGFYAAKRVLAESKEIKGPEYIDAIMDLEV